ncbi:hypothetical protein Tco_1216533 [Tanacetum coccineum]
MAGYKHNQLRHKSFDDIQKLFDKALKRVNTFVPMDTEKVEGEELNRESTKKQKVEDETEQEKLKECFEIIPFDEDAVNTIHFATKQAPIDMLKMFDREDLEVLYKIVKDMFKSIKPVGDNRVLWGNLMTMFERSASDEMWREQGRYLIKSWKLIDSCRATEASFENTNLGKRIAFLENEHSKSFAKWLHEKVERELAIDKESVSETKSGVSVEAIDLHISKEVATIRQVYYYGVLQEIWVLDYCFRQIPLFKYDWVNHKFGGVKRDKLRYTLVDLNNLGHKVDPFVLASQALQVFYVKDPVDKKLSIVFKTPPKNYKDKFDKVDEEFSTAIHHRNVNVLPLVDRCDLANESRDDY